MKLADITKDEFVRRSVLFVSASVGIAFVNYLFHPVLSRLLSVEDFGETQALISLYAQLGIILGAFSVVIMNITANAENEQQRGQTIAEIRRLLLLPIAVIFAGVVLFSPWIASFFHFQSYYPFLVLAAMLPLNLLLVARNAYLQGRGDFLAVSWSGFLSSSGRLLFAVGLILLGWQTLGAIAGIFLAQALAFAYVYRLTRQNLPRPVALHLSGWQSPQVRAELVYGVLVLLASGSIAFLSSADIVFAKRFLSPEDAGLYSGVSAVAKIIFFATSPLVGVLFPAIKLKNSREENRQLMLKSLGMVLALGGAASLTLYLFSARVVNLLIGARYVEKSFILAELSLLMLLVSLINLFVNYFLALRRYWLAVPAILVMVGTVVWLAGHPSDGHGIVQAFTWAAAAYLVLLVTAYGADEFRAGRL
jgi:O-antigen/teichoic acid export membrane protein